MCKAGRINKKVGRLSSSGHCPAFLPGCKGSSGLGGGWCRGKIQPGPVVPKMSVHVPAKGMGTAAAGVEGLQGNFLHTPEPGGGW